ncbi:MAG: arginine deiminase [Clostridia bacterium]|nr:arginine deiminase [Clostridia bacterium]
MQSPILVQSEVGRLKTVMVHRPGAELENLMPEYMARQLFDDIPYLVHAREEHDVFTKTLENCGVRVLYLEELLKEAIASASCKEELIWEYVREANIQMTGAEQAISEYLSELPLCTLVSTMGGGIRKSQLPTSLKKHLVDFIEDAYPFYVDPMPNLYFTRDPFANVGTGVLISRMQNEVRHRETLFAKYIFKYHPVYKWVRKWHDRTDIHNIEGGDCLVLNASTLAIGISERTSPQAIELVANRLISPHTGITRIIAINIPKVRAFMHLDTVMTMVDKDTFVIHPNIMQILRCFVLCKEDDKLRIEESRVPFVDLMKEVLGKDEIRLIECGGGGVIDAAREQWNDGANTLAIAPGEVITYSRNYVTNRILREKGFTVHEIPSAELSRGRGGPRCMSMPFIREAID